MMIIYLKLIASTEEVSIESETCKFALLIEMYICVHLAGL